MRVQAAAPYLRTLGLIGIILASIGVILLIWMGRVKQEVLRQESLYMQGAEEGLAYAHAYFRGDLIGYTKNSRALKSVRTENRRALLALANAVAVFHRRSNFSGEIPDYVKAFDTLDNDPAALLAFRELVLYATPAGRVYGLCGLYFKRSGSYSLARTHLIQAPQSLVWVWSTYDVLEQMDTRKLAEKSESICLEIGRAVQ